MENARFQRNVSRRRFLKLSATGAVVAVVAGVGAYLTLQQPLPQPAATPVRTPSPMAPPAPAVTPTPSPVAPRPSPTPTPAPAPSPPKPTPTLLEKAQQEGSVMVYNPWGEDAVKKVKEGFEAKYPKITMEYKRGYTDLIERALAERRAGRDALDLYLGSHPYALSLLEQDLIAKYTSEVDKEYPPHLRGPDGMWLMLHAPLIVIAYHTSLPKSDIPQTFWDVLDPKFKGKITMPDLNLAPYLLPLMENKMIGRDKWSSWITSLKKQNLKIAPGWGPMLTMVVNREADIALFAYTTTLVLGFMQKGAPLDYVTAKGTVMGEPNGAYINKFAPHPNAARLLRDYAASREGMGLIRDLGVWLPLRSDIPHKLKVGIKVEDVELSAGYSKKEIDDAQARYNEVFK